MIYLRLPLRLLLQLPLQLFPLRLQHLLRRRLLQVILLRKRLGSSVRKSNTSKLPKVSYYLRVFRRVRSASSGPRWQRRQSTN